MFIPEGFKFSAVSCGIKKPDKLDLALIYSPYKLTAWGVFTKNSVKAAPVILGKKLIKEDKISGIVANSGVANACTGEEGLIQTKTLLENIAQKLNLSYKNFLPASTGVIGELLPLEKMLSKIDELISCLSSENYISFAKAIMTTDTFPKVISKKTRDNITIMGIAKGAGMIAPNMATMLGFIITDAKISKNTLKKLLSKMIEQSFNRITIDSDTSTNDTVYMVCSNKKDIQDWDDFENTCIEVAKELAYLIVKDGEGASKLIKIVIKGAKTKKEAKNLAFAVANSPLVKTAFYGEDPNWGRILAALGKTGINFYPDKIEIYLNNLPWIKNLKTITKEETLKKEMQKDELELLVKLKEGKQSYEILTTDFTEDYIKINAHYRT